MLMVKEIEAMIKTYEKYSDDYVIAEFLEQLYDIKANILKQG